MLSVKDLLPKTTPNIQSSKLCLANFIQASPTPCYPSADIFTVLENRPTEKNVDRDFRISYVFNLSAFKYTINDKLSCFSHTHSCGCYLDQMDGNTFIKYEGDLLKSEEVLIHHLCLAKLSTTQMATALESVSDRHAFSPVLLHRMRVKHLRARYGNDMHDFPGLYDKCKQLQREGSVFNFLRLLLILE